MGSLPGEEHVGEGSWGCRCTKGHLFRQEVLPKVPKGDDWLMGLLSPLQILALCCVFRLLQSLISTSSLTTSRTMPLAPSYTPSRNGQRWRGTLHRIQKAGRNGTGIYPECPRRSHGHSPNLAGSSWRMLEKGMSQGRRFRNKAVSETKEVGAFSMVLAAWTGLDIQV